MFRKSAEQQIMREADRIVSMKEDIDAMSWNRVIEIAKLLQAEHTEEQREEWARELLSIARTNSWVLDKFGVAEKGMTGQVIPSGIEVQHNDRYLSETSAAEIPSAGEKPEASEDALPTAESGSGDQAAQDGVSHEHTAAEEELRSLEALYDQLVSRDAGALAEERASAEEPIAAAESESVDEADPDDAPHAEKQQDPVGRLPVVDDRDSAQDLDARAPYIETKGVLRKKRRAEKRARREKRDADVFSIPTAAPAHNSALDFEQIETPDFGQNAMSLEEAKAAARLSEPKACEPACNLDAEPACKPEEKPMGKHAARPAHGRALEPERVPSLESETERSSAVPLPESEAAQSSAVVSLPESEAERPSTAPSPKPEAAQSSASEPSPAQTAEQPRGDLARFKHLYANKRGSLCLYEDADGHLVAVDPSRFA